MSRIRPAAELQTWKFTQGDNNTSYKVLEQFYSALMYESAYLVDSFFYYIEIDEKIRGRGSIFREDRF